MRILKTITIYIIIVVVVLQALSVYSTTTSLYEETNPSNYDVGMNLLTEIGIIDKIDAQKDESSLISRAELALLLVRLRGYNDIAYANSKKRFFYDVDPDYYENAYINVAVQTGLMEEVSEGFFQPTKAVKFIDAVKSMVTLLGYEAVAGLSGGNDTAYLAVASQKGLLKGINIKESTITRGDIYKITVNSLSVGIISQKTYGDPVEYSNSKNKTLLTEYHGIHNHRGIVTANEISSLNEANTARKGLIEIDGISYYTNNANYNDLLGYQVTYYYTDHEGNFELVYAYPINNEVELLEKREIISFSNFIYSYTDENGNKKEAKTQGAYFIYNGKSMSGNNADFIPDFGEVILIDNNSDGNYDVVLINSYEQYKVASINEDKRLIRTKDDKILNVDIKDVKIIKCEFNTLMDFNEIKKDAIIAVGYDCNNEIVKILYRYSFIQGEISEIEESQDEMSVIINGEKYLISRGMQNSIDNKYESALEMGVNSIFRLNHKGEIASWEFNQKSIGENSWEFAVLTGAKLEKFDSDLTLRLFTQTNQFESFKVDSIVNLDGVITKDLGTVYNKLCCNGQNGPSEDFPVTQIIRFKLNGEGLINYIDLAADSPSDEEGLYKDKDYGEEILCYSSLSKNFQRKFAINSNTLALQAPTIGGRIDGSDENYMMLTKATNLFSNYTLYDNLTTYKVKANQLYADLILHAVREDISADFAHEPLYIFLKSLDAVDLHGNIRKKVYYASKDQVNSLYLADNMDIEKIPVNDGTIYSLKSGDAFRFQMNSRNEISKIEPITDSDNWKVLGKGKYPDDRGGYKPLEAREFYVGYLQQYKDGIIKGVSTNPSDLTQKGFIYNISDFQFFVYDKRTKTLNKGNETDLVDYISSGNNCSRIVLHSHWSNIIDMIVYNDE
jgi:hypothetical protein